MSIKHGNLFYFLTNNIEGLKGSNINDIIWTDLIHNIS